MNELKVFFKQVQVGNDLVYEAKAINDFDYEFVGYGDTPKEATINMIERYADKDSFWILKPIKD